MKLSRRLFVASTGMGVFASKAVKGQNRSKASYSRESSASGAAETSDGGGPKAVVLAVDALDPKMTGRFLDDMPALRRIVEEGYSGSVLPYASTWGNLNYMSMMTGTAPGTHYRALYPDGSPPITSRCTAEPLWQTLGRAGRRSMLVTFPQGSPSGTNQTAAVACGGLSGSHLFRGVVHQTRSVRDGIVDTTGHETSGWPPGGGPRVGRLSQLADDPRPSARALQDADSKLPALETELDLSADSRNRWLAVAIARENTEYRSILLYPDPDKPPVAELSVGTWSPWIRHEFGRAGGASRGLIRFKLIALSADGSGFQLLQSACCPADIISEPAEIGTQLLRHLGPYSAISSIGMYPHDPYWREGVAESLEREMWIARAAELGLDQWDWDLFLTKFSLIDNAKHQCAMPVDPDYHRYDPKEAALYEEVLREAHIAMDAVFAEYLRVCEQEGINLLIVGDHGMGLNNVICDINRLLQKSGLQSRTPAGEIDWGRTKAYVKRSRQGSEVCINLQGREENGIVSPDEYADIQTRIIDALLDWRDPDTGGRAVAYALRGRDASALGYWGAAFGDVAFAYNPGFSWGVLEDGADIGPSVATGTNHGAQIPTAETSYNSNLGVLYAWGPGIKPGQRDEEMLGPIPIDQMGPSLSRLLDCPVSKDATAAPIRDMLI